MFWICAVKVYKNPSHEWIFCKAATFMLSGLTFKKKLNILDTFFKPCHHVLVSFCPSKYSVSTVVLFWMPLHSKSLIEWVHPGRQRVYFYQHCFVATASSKQTSARPEAAAALKRKHRCTDCCIELHKPSRVLLGFLFHREKHFYMPIKIIYVPASWCFSPCTDSLCFVVPCWSVEQKLPQHCRNLRVHRHHFKASIRQPKQRDEATWWTPRT